MEVSTRTLNVAGNALSIRDAVAKYEQSSHKMPKAFDLQWTGDMVPVLCCLA